VFAFLMAFATAHRFDAGKAPVEPNYVRATPIAVCCDPSNSPTVAPRWRRLVAAITHGGAPRRCRRAARGLSSAYTTVVDAAFHRRQCEHRHDFAARTWYVKSVTIVLDTALRQP
jgi:hypothetical protein